MVFIVERRDKKIVPVNCPCLIRCGKLQSCCFPAGSNFVHGTKICTGAIVPLENGITLPADNFLPLHPRCFQKGVVYIGNGVVFCYNNDIIVHVFKDTPVIPFSSFQFLPEILLFISDFLILQRFQDSRPQPLKFILQDIIGGPRFHTLYRRFFVY